MHSKLTEPEPCEIIVRVEFDIVLIRNNVRRLARAAGLNLPRQARITTASSTVVRALLACYSEVACGLRLVQTGGHNGLELVCLAARQHQTIPTNCSQLQRGLQEVGMLVDVLEIAPASGPDAAIRLLLAMWLEGGDLSATRAGAL